VVLSLNHGLNHLHLSWQQKTEVKLHTVGHIIVASIMGHAAEEEVICKSRLLVCVYDTAYEYGTQYITEQF